jgi:hypothetical protein
MSHPRAEILKRIVNAVGGQQLESFGGRRSLDQVVSLTKEIPNVRRQDAGNPISLTMLKLHPSLDAQG